MRQFNVWRFPHFWRTTEDNAQDKETSPLIPKGNGDTEADVFSSTNGEERHDGKVWQGESMGEGGAWETAKSCDFLLKSLLFLCNLVFCVLGLVTLAVGLWGLMVKESFSQERMGHMGADPMLVFVCAGVALALLCLSGCVGTLRENVCLLGAFSISVLALLATQVLAAIAAYTLHDQIHGYLRSAMLLAVTRYQDDLDLRFITDEIQTGLQCCGVDSYQDWETNMYFNCSSMGVRACGVPPSCCLDPLENGTVWNSQCGARVRTMDEFSAQSQVFLGGCLGAISRWVEQNTSLLSTVGVVLLGVQVLVVFVSMRLLSYIQRSKPQH